MCVTAHRRLVDRDLRTAGVGECHELRSYDREQCLGDLPAIADEPAGEGVRAGHSHLQHRPVWRHTAQALELLDGPEPTRRGEVADDAVLRALVVRGRTEEPLWLALLDPLEEAVEAEVEVEPSLLAVRDHVETRGDLVVDGCDHRVLLELGCVVRPELVQVFGGVFEPAGKGVAPDHGRSQRRHVRILAP